MKVLAAALILAASAAVSYGAFLLHPAAGWIVGGTLLYTLGYHLYTGQRATGSDDKVVLSNGATRGEVRSAVRSVRRDLN